MYYWGTNVCVLNVFHNSCIFRMIKYLKPLYIMEYSSVNIEFFLFYTFYIIISDIENS